MTGAITSKSSEQIINNTIFSGQISSIASYIDETAKNILSYAQSCDLAIKLSIIAENSEALKRKAPVIDNVTYAEQLSNLVSVILTENTSKKMENKVFEALENKVMQTLDSIEDVLSKCGKHNARFRQIITREITEVDLLSFLDELKAKIPANFGVNDYMRHKSETYSHLVSYSKLTECRDSIESLQIALKQNPKRLIRSLQRELHNDNKIERTLNYAA